MNKRKNFSLKDYKFAKTKYNEAVQKPNPLTDYSNNFIGNNPSRYLQKNMTIFPLKQKRLINYFDNSQENLKINQKNPTERNTKKQQEILQSNEYSLENNLDSSMDTIKNILFGTDKKITQMDSTKKNTQNELSQNRVAKEKNDQKAIKHQNSIDLSRNGKKSFHPEFIPNYYDLGSKYLVRNYITNDITNINYHKIPPKKISMNRLYNNKPILVSTNYF